MFRNLIVFSACVLIAATAAFASPLFDRGRTEWRIAVPEKPGVALSAAATELKETLRKVSGADFAIEEVADAPRAKLKGAIVIEASLPRSPDDLIEIHERADGIRLLANSERATQYAVSRFLQDRLGCRWFWPGEISPNGETAGGAYLPELKSYQPKTYDYRFQPKFRFRELSQCSYHGHTPTERWLIRNGINCGRQGGGFPRECFVKTGVGAHAVGLNPKEFAEHPEMFALVGGKRAKDGVAGCWSNADFIRRMQDLCLKLGTNSDILVAFPADVCQRCECAACTKNPDRSSRWYEFYDLITKPVRALKPDLLVGGLAYQEYAAVPAASVDWLEYNEYCQYDRCYIHKLGDPDCVVNRNSMRRLKAWQERCRMGIYGYHFDAFDKAKFVPLWNVFADEFRTCAKLGIVRMKTEMPIGRNPKRRPEELTWVASRLSYWIYAQLAWNPDADVDALLKDWCDHVYGEGAQPMLEYLRSFAARWEGQKGHISYFGSLAEGFAPDLLDRDYITVTRAKFDAAKELVMKSVNPDAAMRSAYNVEIERRLFEEWVKAYETGVAKQVKVKLSEKPVPMPLNGAMWLHGRTWGKPHQPTTIEVWTTEEALRIRAVSTEENMAEVYRGETGRDAPIFQAESIEFFLGVGDGVYRQLGVDMAGGTYDALGQDASWNFDWQAKTSADAKGWTADVTLPYKELALDGKKPKAGECWRLSVIRNNKDHEPVGFPGPVYRDLSLMAKIEF